MALAREMAPEDVDAVSELLCRCYRWLAHAQGFTAQQVAFLTSERGSPDTVRRESQTELYLVATEQDTIVGVVAVKDHEITRLYVHPDRHRRGVGTLLFRAATDAIRARGHPEVSTVAIGRSVVPFYERMGMSVTGHRECRRPELAPWEGIVMKGPLGEGEETTPPSSR